MNKNYIHASPEKSGQAAVCWKVWLILYKWKNKEPSFQNGRVSISKDVFHYPQNM